MFYTFCVCWGGRGTPWKLLSGRLWVFRDKLQRVLKAGGIDLCEQCWEVGWRLKRERTLVYLQLTHVDTWQGPTHYWEAIFLQLKISKFGGEKNYLQVRFKQLL